MNMFGHSFDEFYEYFNILIFITKYIHSKTICYILRQQIYLNIHLSKKNHIDYTLHSPTNVSLVLSDI